MADLAGAVVGEQTQLIASLSDPDLHEDSCREVRVIETHISYVLLTGRYAYKIKKAVDLGFLDFTTLSARHFYCDQELALNRRLAPHIYLQVVAITGTPDAPRIGGDGPVLEYAVKMREFPQDALLPIALARGDLTAAHIDALAATVAAFHKSVATAPASSTFGSPDDVLALAEENFTEIELLLDNDIDRYEVADVRGWTRCEFAARAAAFAARHRDGFVRECHGDLHLGNIALVDGSVTVFDCIEFNDHMRWSDVMADVAFLVMDLRERGRSDFASRFLNAYLELTGDYDGVPILRFYIVYRAIVRAKVACLRAHQTMDAEAATKLAEYREYVRLAARSTESTARGIAITHGLTGSGKTTHSQTLVDLAGAIRIRTDVERKRLHGLTPRARSGSTLNAGLYSPAETERVYSNIARLTRTVINAGYAVVVDGTFLQRRERDQFRALAADLNAPFAIVDFVAPLETLRARVRNRYTAGLDASEADLHVLEHQLHTAEPLTAAERVVTVTYDADASPGSAPPNAPWQHVQERLRVGAGAIHAAARPADK